MSKEEEAVRYIRDRLREGVSQERIIEELARIGWDYRTLLGFIEMAKAPLFSGDSPTPQMAAAGQWQSSEGKKTENKKTKAVIGGIALAAILIAGGGYAYEKFTGPTPPEVLQKTMMEMTTVKSFSFSLDGTLETPTSSPATSARSATVTLSGDFSFQNPQNSAYRLTIKGNMGVGTSFPLVVDSEIISSDKFLYLKINPGTSIGPISFNMIANQWIKIDLSSDLAKTLFLSGLTIQVPTTTLSLTPEKTTKVKDFVRNASLFKDVESLPAETVDGVNTYHYSFKPDIVALQKLALNIGSVVGVSSTSLPIASSTNAFGSIYVNTRGEIWIGKSDFLIRKLLISDIRGNAMKLAITNYNNTPEILVPFNAKPLQDVLGSLFGGAMVGK